MRDQETDEKLWARITAAFLRAPARPNSLETEAFVTKVIGRLEPAQEPWFAAGLRWLVPAASFALALSVFFVLRPAAEYSEPADALLLMKGETSTLARLTSQRSAPTAADLLAFTLEDR
jgi:hypothetical protein